jgi:signal peptidase II
MDGVTGAGVVGRDGAAALPVTKVVMLAVIVLGVLTFDLSTKLLVQRYFVLYDPVDIVGEYLRLTYIYNPGAAFGISLGEHSRVVFLALSVVALVALFAMYWYTPATDRTRLTSIALICGGAIGNLIDRVRSEAGVVDFIDVGVGDLRWPVFNIADMAVTTGAIILALSLWREEQTTPDGS